MEDVDEATVENEENEGKEMVPEDPDEKNEKVPDNDDEKKLGIAPQSSRQ